MRTYLTAGLTLVLSALTIGPTLAATNNVESNVRINSGNSGTAGPITQAKETFINKYGFDPYKLNTNSRHLLNCSVKTITVTVFNANDKARIVPFMTVKVAPGKASGILNCKDATQKGCVIRIDAYPPVVSVPSPVVAFDSASHVAYYTNSDALLKGCSAFDGVSRARAKNAWGR